MMNKPKQIPRQGAIVVQTQSQLEKSVFGYIRAVGHYLYPTVGTLVPRQLERKKTEGKVTHPFFSTLFAFGV